MVDRQVTEFRDVTQQVAKQTPDTFGQIGEFVGKINAANQEAKINKNLSQAQLELNDYVNKWQLANQSNPDYKSAEFIEGRNAIFDKYSQDISPMYKLDWNKATREVMAKNDFSMQSWQFKQTQENTVNNINDTMQANFAKYNQLGAEYGSGKISDLEAIIDFKSDANRLMGYGSKFIGEEATRQKLQDYSPDAIKSFISGVAGVNKDKALELLKDEKLTSNLTPKEKQELTEVTIASAKKLDIDKLLIQSKTEHDFLDKINQGGNYYNNRLEIDKAEANGFISSNFAADARRVISSAQAIDAVSDKPLMNKLVEEMYDLNAQADSGSNKEYLLGIRNINNKIAQLRADGKLSQEDAIKITNQSKTLFAAKQAQATNDIAFSFRNANAMIKQQLPPEMRADATRQLFYMTSDSNFMPKAGDKNAYNPYAQKIIDNINTVRRDKVLNNINTVITPIKPKIKTGTIIENKSTGEKMIFKDGKWQKM